MKACPNCKGEGRGEKACSPCSGLGKHSCMCGNQDHICGSCQGSGLIPCPICNGRGAVRGARKGFHLVGKGLTRLRDGEYITRHTRRELTREHFVIEQKTGGEAPPLLDEEAMKYHLQKIDLENLTPTQEKYRNALTAALRQCKWNVSQTAKRVGLSRASMYRRIHVLSIKIPPGQGLKRGPSIFDHKIAGVVVKGK